MKKTISRTVEMVMEEAKEQTLLWYKDLCDGDPLWIELVKEEMEDGSFERECSKRLRENIIAIRRAAESADSCR